VLVALNVLVVDDSAVMRTMISKVLRLCGTPIGAVYQASNGSEGLETLSRNRIGLVMADINMPVMNGIEMIQRMRANPQMEALPVIVISTDGSETRSIEIGALGARLVQKPFSPETLRDAINAVMGVKDDERSEGRALPGDSPDF
jgi:two-component system chemotaxis response regulator CheY